MDRHHNDEVLLCTIEEAERTLRVSRSTIYELLRDGRLQHVKIGKSTRITAESIRQLVAQLIEQSRNAA